MTSTSFREPDAARAGGYVLARSLLVVVDLIFHPVPPVGPRRRLGYYGLRIANEAKRSQPGSSL